MALLPTRATRPPTAEELLRAREVIAQTLEPTPLVEATIGGVRVWLKLESLQPTGSFKVRGALAAIDHVSQVSPGRAVVTCSAGNHGLGVAFAARRLEVPATVVVPKNASRAKVDTLASSAVELVLAGETYGEAEAVALELAASRGSIYVSPYNDALVIAGQATVAAEVLTQHPTVSDLVVSVGGGGLLGGSILATAGHAARVHGALVEQNAAFATMLRGDLVDESRLMHTIADGLAGGIEAGTVTLDIARSAGVELHLVSEAMLRRALRRSLFDAGVVMEGSGAVAVAAGTDQAASFGEEIVIVVSGRNITEDLLRSVLADQTL